MDWSTHLSHRMSRIRASEIRELLKLLDQPHIISFGGGIPDPALFPATGLKQAYDEILTREPDMNQALQYSVSEGYGPLRDWIAAYMQRKGVTCSRDNIVIMNGSQQALDFIGKCYISPGDKILVQAPTYLGALQAFNAYEPLYGHIALGERDNWGQGGRLIYLVPDFANPNGVTMALADRHAVLDEAYAHDAIVVEDAAYTDLRYRGDTIPCLLSLDAARSGGIDKGRTIYCGSFSKTHAPGLRLGWVCAPKPVIEKLVLIKQGADLNSSTINQMVLARVLEMGYEAHLNKLRTVYGKRLDAMYETLQKTMPPGISWTHPDGGMFIWVTLPPHMNATDLLQQAIKDGVAFVPGGAFFTDGSGQNTLRLSFSLADENKLAAGIDRLVGTIHKQMVL